MKIYVVLRLRDYAYDEWLYYGSDLAEAEKIWKDEGGYDQILGLTETGYNIIKW